MCPAPRASLLLTLLLSGCATLDASPAVPGSTAGAVQEPRIERIEVVDSSRGCELAEEHSHTLTRHGSGLSSARQGVTDVQAQRIWAALASSRTLVADPLTELGFTPEAAHAHRREFLGAALGSHRPLSTRQAQELGLELPFEQVAAALHGQLEWGTMGTDQFTFKVTLTRAGRTLIAESQAALPWMLPWRVTLDGETWLTYSVTVPKALTALVAKDAPLYHLLRRGERYWREDVWGDSVVWSRLENAAEAEVGRQLLLQLPHRSDALQDWEVKGVQLVDGDNGTAALFVQLTRDISAPHAGVVNAAWWRLPMEGGRLTSSWRELETAIAGSESVLRDQSWLRAWVRASPGRTVELQVDGGLRDARAVEPPSHVLATWRVAGLHGRPTYELVLRHEATWAATLYFSPDEARALAAVVHQEEAGPLLGGEDVWLDPNGGGNYLLVSPDGTLTPGRLQLPLPPGGAR